MSELPTLCDAREKCCGTPACLSAGLWAEDPYDAPIGVFEGTRWHMHSEPICADPDCVTYLTRPQMATMRARATARVAPTEPCIAPPGNLCTDTGCWDADRCVVVRATKDQP